MTSAVTTKSGKGLSYGVVSELATYWEVLPGHEDELRAATQRFAAVLSAVHLSKNIHTGLRDQRHVIFNNGQRLMWATTFENDSTLLRGLCPDRHRALPGLDAARHHLCRLGVGRVIGRGREVQRRQPRRRRARGARRRRTQEVGWLCRARPPDTSTT